MFRKILIANRGEIAIRIARSLRRMGIEAATVHSNADANALHVQDVGESVLIGGDAARESYLNIDAVIGAAKQVGADAIHPGFGFLSESAAFAHACADARIAFIGPTPASLALFGDKAAAKRLARALDIPVAAGIDEPSDDVDALVAAVSRLPLPCILKAAAGGGGKGMRVVRERAQIRASVEAAIREGRSAFGDGRLIAEAYLSTPRHIEVQILGDGRGKVIHLYDRECSLQRRYQKVIEEAPVTSLPEADRQQLWSQAIAIGSAAAYLGVGTVEFAVTSQGAVFLEVNPRLQVEHPVTESVTGLDIVELQVRTVAKKALPLAQEDVPPPRGVAVQARLYAEDPRRGFLPATGRVASFTVPVGVRVDAGVASGSTITPHYDPMIAKLIAHGDDRHAAISRLREALVDTSVLGVTNNRAFLARLLAEPAVQDNDVNTEFIDEWLGTHPLAEESPRDVAVLAAIWLQGQREDIGPRAGAWADAALATWRIQRGEPRPLPFHTMMATGTSATWRVGFAREASSLLVRVDDEVFHVALPLRSRDEAEIRHVIVDGCSLRVQTVRDAHLVHGRIGANETSLEMRALHDAARGSSSAGHGAVRAPMMGIIIGVDAVEGRKVAAGDRLAIMESMKMEMAINAPVDGVVAWVGCETRGKVERHQDLFRIEPAA